VKVLRVLFVACLVLALPVGVWVYRVTTGALGERQGMGQVTTLRRDVQSIADAERRQQRVWRQLPQENSADRPHKQILFGDLHAHTTYSFDAYNISLPMYQGEGSHPPGDACDFARYCSGLDFWSINDHAEGLTPRQWSQTREMVRQCNAAAGDPANPDMVTFLGWEWTQIGDTPADHYGHKNVILRDTGGGTCPHGPSHPGSSCFPGDRIPTA
jgi:hypothetical protein